MNGIEKELAGRACVLRVNLSTRDGKSLATRFCVNSAGTIIVLDSSGAETYRHVGFPRRKEILSAAGIR